MFECPLRPTIVFRVGIFYGDAPILIENFNRSTPALALGVVNLSKIQDLPLDDFSAPASAILHNTPVTMFFAVFKSWIALGSVSTI
jgi:hypothetical protein